MNPPLLSSQLPQIAGYHIIEQLGSGAYGTVFRAEKKGQTNENGERIFYACKLIKCQKIQEGIPSTAIRQCGLLKHFSHPNLVKLQEIIPDDKKLTLVFECCEADLKQYIYGIPREIGMDPINVKVLCYQLLKGIQYIHSKKVLHRDLKPQNLLINTSPNLVLKVADFGLSRTCAFPTKGYAHEVVTLWYRPPDILLESDRYFYSIDMWGVGCIFSEMSTMRVLFKGNKEQEQLNRIFKILGTPTEESWPGVTSLPGWNKFKIQNFQGIPLSALHERLDEDGIDLLVKMLQPNPRKRITATQALKHPYFFDLPDTVRQIYDPNYKKVEKPKETLRIRQIPEQIQQQNEMNEEKNEESVKRNDKESPQEDTRKQDNCYS